MNKRFTQFIGLSLILAGMVTAGVESTLRTPLTGALRTPGLHAWIASFHPREAAYALKNYSGNLEELSIFGVGGYQSGKLAVEKEFVQAAVLAARQQKEEIRILLTIANNRPGKIGDRRLLRRWIATAEGQKKHIEDLVNLAEAVDGLDIDYENLYPTDGPRYALFISQLAQALHARGKYLSVTVERNALLYASIDWTDLSTRVDRIRVMAYPYHYARSSPGPISPPAEVARLSERALRRIPADKLEIALPLYGFDWRSWGQGKVITTMRQYRNLTKQPGAHVFRDPETQCARIQYEASEFVRGKKRIVAHEVWFEDPHSVAYKVQMLRQLGVVQLGLWQLGVGNISELFELVKTPPPSLGPQVASLSMPDSATVTTP